MTVTRSRAATRGRRARDRQHTRMRRLTTDEDGKTAEQSTGTEAKDQSVRSMNPAIPISILWTAERLGLPRAKEKGTLPARIRATTALAKCVGDKSPPTASMTGGRQLQHFLGHPTAVHPAGKDLTIRGAGDLIAVTPTRARHPDNPWLRAPLLAAKIQTWMTLRPNSWESRQRPRAERKANKVMVVRSRFARKSPKSTLHTGTSSSKSTLRSIS